MAKKAKMKMKDRKKYQDRYRYVILRLWGRELDPEKITRAMGIEPDDWWFRGPAVNQKGDVVIDKKTGKPWMIFPYGQWILRSRIRGNSKLVTRIQDIWEQIEPKKKILRRILKEVKADLKICVEPSEHLYRALYNFPAEILNKFTAIGIDMELSIHNPQNMRKIRKKVGVE